MNKDTVRTRIKQIGIIPAIRLSSADDALFAAEAVVDSGIPILEVTMTVPNALDVISRLALHNSELVVGAGTISDVETAHRCLDAGALFLTSPGFIPEIVDFALQRDVVVFPGALTPTEIMTAWKSGADFVKVFPCSTFGGASYIRALKSPFPHIPLIASGGVNQQTAAEFIRSGAIALGIGRELIHPDAVKRRERDWIRELAGRFLQMINEARGQQLPG